MKKKNDNKIKEFIIRIFAKELLVSSLLAFLIGFTPVIAHAQIFNPAEKNQACQGVGAGSGGCVATPEAKVNTTLKDFINIFSVIIGIITVIMVMIAGFKYITSNGDTGAVTSAKNTLIWALVGAAIVSIAQVLVHFVLFRVNQSAAGG